MARIELEPGEKFEHIHTGPSRTYLISGVVELAINGTSAALTPTPVSIPAGRVHVMHNIGSVPAVIGCDHPRPGPRDPEPPVRSSQ